MPEDNLSGWPSSPSTTVCDTHITMHPIGSDDVDRHVAVCGALPADIDRSRMWDPTAEDACERCVEQAA